MDENLLIQKLALLKSASDIPFFIFDAKCNQVYPNKKREDIPLPISQLKTLLKEKNYPFLFQDQYQKSFGIIKHDKFFLIFGPASTEEQDKGISSVSLLRFAHLIAYLELESNQNSIDPISLLAKQNDVQEEIKRKNATSLEESKNHDTYYFEQMILSYVKNGDSEGLKPFLFEYTKQTHLQVGKLADDALRQAKNVAIGFAAVVGKFGAIPGGLNIEESYRLIDEYSQRIEKAQSLNDVADLQYNLLMDFTKRVKKISQKTTYSIDVDYAIQYIKNHIKDIVGVMDVVEDIGKSRSYLLKKFKEEVGIPMGKFMMKCKLEGAAMTLLYSNLPLIDVSNYFNFSSQSYFQNTFKRQFGVTPATYRKNKGLSKKQEKS